MKLLRLVMCAAAFAIVEKMAFAEDIDIRAVQAKLAESESRLAGLQDRVKPKTANANIAGAPDAILSINKNAVVSVGGTVNTRYYYHNIRLDGEYDGDGRQVPFGRRHNYRMGDLLVSDAKLRVTVDVNEHFDAYLQVDLQSSDNVGSDNAEIYWVRWKNICNSGFGLKVGRDALVFGQEGYGVLANWTNGIGDGIGRALSWIDNGWIPLHNGWDIDRVTQITPYWEGLDGRLRVEVMFAQKVNNSLGSFGLNRTSNLYRIGPDEPDPDDPDSIVDTTSPVIWKSKNWGIGTMSARINYMPVEGLNLQASIINYHDQKPIVDIINKNNTALSLGFNWTPRFMPKMTLWGQWIHGWNVNYGDARQSNAINAGLAFAFNEQFNIFAQGDYLNSKDNSLRDSGWASYIGAQYALGYGVSLEAGWRHEAIKFFAMDSNTRRKALGDTLYAHVGFDF